MREIKFRAWDTERKEWYQEGNPSGLTFKGFHLFGECMAMDFPNISDIGKLEVSQFTGLLDKNGVEIYDGDIIKWGHTDGCGSENWHRYAKVQFNPDIQFKIIFYIDSNTNEKKPSDDYIFKFGNFAYQDTERYIEVIGNIYENPELLEQQ